MKTIKTSHLFAASALALSAFVGQAQAQTLTYQVRVSPTKTVDLLNAKAISTAPSDQFVWDHNGQSHPAKFANVDSIVAAPFFSQIYVHQSGGLFINVTQLASVECVNSQTLITWLTGKPTYVGDGCAFSDAVKALSRP